jgi:hypothetical protein
LGHLFGKPLCKADVEGYLRSSKTICLQAVQLARSLMDRYHEVTDPQRYHDAAWLVIRLPYANPFQYRFALMQAETACRLAPEEAKYRTMLGSAQYRVGNYVEARSTLAKADRLHRAGLARLAGLGQQPLQLLAPLCQAQPLRQAVLANQVFLAMTYYQLGQEEQAQAALARLREAAQQGRWDKDEEAHDLQRQAEAVGGVKGRGTKK